MTGMWLEHDRTRHDFHVTKTWLDTTKTYKQSTWQGHHQDMTRTWRHMTGALLKHGTRLQHRDTTQTWQRHENIMAAKPVDRYNRTDQDNSKITVTSWGELFRCWSPSISVSYAGGCFKQRWPKILKDWAERRDPYTDFTLWGIWSWSSGLPSISTLGGEAQAAPSENKPSCFVPIVRPRLQVQHLEERPCVPHVLN